MHEAICPNCGIETFAVPDKKAFQQLALESAPYACSILRCQKCGMRWLTPFPLIENGEQLYDSDYFRSTMQNGHSYQNEKSELAICYNNVAERFLKLGVQDGLLDIGCGTGDFLLTAQSRGLLGEGLEPSKFACDAAIQKGLSVHCQTLEDFFSWNDNRFDGIHCSHVLEHALDLHVFLDMIHDLLKPGAPIYIEVPLQFDGAVDYINRIRNLKPLLTKHSLHHHYFFSPPILVKLLKEHGFRTTSIRTHLYCRRATRTKSLRNWALQLSLWIADKLAQRGDIISIWAVRRP